MRAWLLLIALVLVAIPCHAAANCFASTTLTGAGPSAAINTTGATLLVAVTGVDIGYVNYLNDSAGNLGHWNATSAWSDGTTARPIAMITYVVNPATSATHTFSLASGVYQTYPAVVVFACNGTTLDHPLAEQVGRSGTSSASTFQLAAVTPVEAGDLIISNISTTNAYTSATIDSGFSTPVGVNAGASNMSTVGAWLAATSTASVNPTWTTSTTGWTGLNAVFKAASAAASPTTPPSVKTVVGNSVEGFAGDGGAALSANIDYPGQMVIESHGLIVFADVTNNRIRAYNPTGSSVTAYGVTIPSLGVNTIAGNGILGYVYNIAPLSAEMGHPVGLAIDHSSDCIYVADQQNARVLKFCPTGNLTVVAGGAGGGHYDPLCRTTGQSDPTAAGFSGDGGSPTSALLDCPQALYFDQSINVLYVADSNNHRVRAINFDAAVHTVNGVSIASNTINTVYGNSANACVIAGSGTGSSGAVPLGLVGDSSHNIYMTINACHQVVKLSSSGVPSAIIGTGTLGYSINVPAASAQIAYPFDIDRAGNGDLYLAQAGNCVISRYDSTSGNLTPFLGNFSLYPYVSFTYWGCGGQSGENGSASIAGLGYSIGVHLDSAGNVYVSDIFNSRIKFVNCSGGGCSGTGGGGVTLSPSSFNFGSQSIGVSSSAHPFTLTNGTSSTITGLSVSVTGTNAGDFSQTNTCGTSLGASAVCTINVIFTPSAGGSRSASLTVTDSAGTQTSGLSGTGGAGGAISGTRVTSGAKFVAGTVIR